MVSIFNQLQIERKTFNKRLTGFDSKEVDELLHKIAADYDSFQKEICELKRNQESLIPEINLKEKESANQSISDYKTIEIIKRLSRLENEVFKEKLKDR